MYTCCGVRPAEFPTTAGFGSRMAMQVIVLPETREWGKALLIVDDQASATEIGMSDAKGITVLGICGSLRKASYNMAALRIAIELKPSGMTIEIADISTIPLYNE